MHATVSPDTAPGWTEVVPTDLHDPYTAVEADHEADVAAFDGQAPS